MFPPPPPPRGWPPYLWLVYLAPVLLPVALGQMGWATGALTVALVILFLSSYLHSFHAEGRGLLTIAVLQGAIGLILGPWHPFASVFGVYAAATAAREERVRVAWRAMAALVVISTLWFWWLSAPVSQLLGAAVVAPLIGAVTLHEERARRADAALAAAHERMASLAASAERERIARDLHDVLGHTLSLVVLKAQVAKRLVRRDVVAAHRELDELEAAARAALTDVRRTIRGYRATLDDEINAARALLAAAGVDVDVRITLPTPDLARDTVLAAVLRELVTNVARHADASRCSIEIHESNGLVRMTVSDDGRGGARVSGSGLTGVAARIRDCGGTLEFLPILEHPHSPARPGTTVVVGIPDTGAGNNTAESAA
jgi:two-component system, NarL family, sensor histidine kinase DesK